MFQIPELVSIKCKSNWQARDQVPSLAWVQWRLRACSYRLQFLFDNKPVSDDVLDDGCVVGDASVAHLHVNHPKELAQTLVKCCSVHSVQMRFYRVQLRYIKLFTQFGNCVDSRHIHSMFLFMLTSRALVMVSTSTPRRKRSIRPVTAASHAEQNTMQCTFVHTYMQLQQFRLLMIPRMDMCTGCPKKKPPCLNWP